MTEIRMFTFISKLSLSSYFFTVRITVTSVLELYLGSAFLAVHLDLLVQLLMVPMLDIEMLSG